MKLSNIDFELSKLSPSKIRMGLDIPLSENIYDTFNTAVGHNLKACQISCLNPGFSQIHDILESRKLLSCHPEMYACLHGNIIYNLAGSGQGSSDPQYNRKLNRSKMGLLDELDIAVMLGIGVVEHIGINKEGSSAYHIIAESINEVLTVENCNTLSYARISGIPVIDFKTKRKIILENCAGRGNAIGKTLDEIAIIMSLINPQLRDSVRVCIDTCHIFDAGQYNFGDIDHTRKFYSDFEKKLGLSKLEMFHMNDSKNSFGSRQDRHEHLTRGHIFNGKNGLQGLRYFIRHTADIGVPLIGEYAQGLPDVKLINEIINN